MTPRTRVAPAKLNLGLQVLRKRSDGYHDVETVLLPIGWADRLTALSAPTLTLTCSDAALPTDDDNLVVRAARDLAAWAGLHLGAELHLDKIVPFGAGLGGGSSDAAAALLLLADVWGVDVPPRVLHGLAARLGSDVPFFLDGRPAVGVGRGDRLRPLLDKGGEVYRCPFALCVAVPEVHVATAEAYGLVRPSADGRPDLGAAVRSNRLDRWRGEVTNDFEAPVIARHPEIGRVKQALLDEGAGWAALSGSGSSVASAFEDASGAARAAQRLAAMGCRVWVEPPSPDGAHSG